MINESDLMSLSKKQTKTNQQTNKSFVLLFRFEHVTFGIAWTLLSSDLAIKSAFYGHPFATAKSNPVDCQPVTLFSKGRHGLTIPTSGVLRVSSFVCHCSFGLAFASMSVCAPHATLLTGVLIRDLFRLLTTRSVDCVRPPVCCTN